MVGLRWQRGSPDTSGTDGSLGGGVRRFRLGGVVCRFDRIIIDCGRAGFDRSDCGRTCRPSGGSRAWPELIRHADAVGGPVESLAPVQPPDAADKIDQPAAFARLVVEPHPGPGTGDHDREAALAAPAPFLARAEGRLAQQLDHEFRHPRAQLGIEGLPVPPAHRRPRPIGRAPAGRTKEPSWRCAGGDAGQADTGGSGTGLRASLPPVLPPFEQPSRRRNRSARPQRRPAGKGVTPSVKA